MFTLVFVSIMASVPTLLAFHAAACGHNLCRENLRLTSLAKRSPGAAAATLAVCFSARQLVITAAHASGARSSFGRIHHLGFGEVRVYAAAMGKRLRHHGDSELMSENRSVLT